MRRFISGLDFFGRTSKGHFVREVLDVPPRLHFLSGNVWTNLQSFTFQFGTVWTYLQASTFCRGTFGRTSKASLFSSARFGRISTPPLFASERLDEPPKLILIFVLSVKIYVLRNAIHLFPSQSMQWFISLGQFVPFRRVQKRGSNFIRFPIKTSTVLFASFYV